ncbi:hypothetical protein LUTEI9C_100049 [Luteimonas sp. 9C]|nr:hypothetical protein LUTEI9C_100049 [Luteimonas sp. 9C]
MALLVTNLTVLKVPGGAQRQTASEFNCVPGAVVNDKHVAVDPSVYFEAWADRETLS